VLGRNATMIQAFRAANDVLLGAVQGIADLIVRPGLINVDFADVRTVMSEMGLAMMGTGTARGDDRAQAAAEAAIQNPLLDDVNLAGANGILVNITAGPDFTMAEFDEVGRTIEGFASEDATVVVGTVLDPDMQDEVRVTVVATGLNRSRCARRSSWSATPPPACRSTTASRWTRSVPPPVRPGPAPGFGFARAVGPGLRAGGGELPSGLPGHSGVPAPPGGLIDPRALSARGGSKTERHRHVPLLPGLRRPGSPFRRP
jgi:cell division protein FtsZ